MEKSPSSRAGNRAATHPLVPALGLWIGDAGGKFLAGSQQEVDIPYQGTKTVRKVHALKSAPRSSAQRRSYNSNKQVTYRLAFTDGTEAILRDDLP